MPCRTGLPVSSSQTSPLESSRGDEARKALLKHLISAPSPSSPRLPWHNTQGCPRYCLYWGKTKKWKDRKIELPFVLDRIWFFFFLGRKRSPKKKKKLKKNSSTSLLHITIHHPLLSLCRLEFNSMSILFHGVLSTVPSLNHHLSQLPPLLDAIFLPASLFPLHSLFPLSLSCGTWIFFLFFFCSSLMFNLDRLAAMGEKSPVSFFRLKSYCKRLRFQCAPQFLLQ